MRNIRDFFLLLLCFSLSAYFILFFKRQENTQILDNYNVLSEFAHNNRYYVVCQEKGVSLELPMENYLVGALAASVPAEYEEELLKAQAIVLRSTLYKKYKEENTDVLNIQTPEFWPDQMMQNIWGEKYEEYVNKCLDAVVQTQGIYLSYGEEPAEGFYHGMSAGKTRSGKELSGDGEYGYLKVTECPDNLSALDYEKEIKISAKSVGQLDKAVRNEEGYVISLHKDGEQISGEKMSENYGFLSSNFTWEEEGDSYIFKIKGKGHGFGLDQYYGNVLAKKGRDYREILTCFFDGITFERME